MTNNLKLEYTTGDLYTQRFEKDRAEDTLILNVGPQHPSTHGVLRVVMELSGEYVLRSEPVLGYLHRMHEKMADVKTWVGYMPNMGRVDYLHPLAWNWSYTGAVEMLGEIEVPERAEYLRVIMTELNRISSHLLWWGAFLLDLGAFTPIMYAFDDREWLMDIMQRPTGSRLTYSYFRLGGVCADIDDRFIEDTRAWIKHVRGRLPMYKGLVTDNVILRKRLEDVGYFTKDQCLRYGVTGPCLRGSDIAYDVRVNEPYSIYRDLDFRACVYPEGDCMARYMVRMDEIVESMSIVEQCLDQIPDGEHILKKPPKPSWKAPEGEAYFATEGGRGKVCVHVVSDGGKNPYKVKLRSPSYCNLSLFSEASQGMLLPDALAVLGSLDLVIPEIDR